MGLIQLFLGVPALNKTSYVLEEALAKISVSSIRLWLLLQFLILGSGHKLLIWFSFIKDCDWDF